MDLSLIFTGGDLSIEQLASVAREAEANGFAGAYMAEAWRSAWVPLTAMAAVTERIKLGPYILNAYGSSPFVAGMAAVDFHEYSNGRLVLGVGGGNKIINEQWQGIAHARVLTKMREYVSLMRDIAHAAPGDSVKFEGKLHSMDWTPAVAAPQPAFPVYLAAVFPAMMRVATQVADGIGGGATLSPEYIQQVLKPRAAEAAAEVDRDPSSIPWMSVAVASVDNDRERARRCAREAICHLYAPLPHPYYEYTMREQGFSKIVDTLLKEMPAGRLEASIDALDDDCIDTICITGTEDEVREQLKRFDGVVDNLLLLNARGVVDGDVAAAYDPILRVAR